MDSLSTGEGGMYIGRERGRERRREGGKEREEGKEGGGKGERMNIDSHIMHSNTWCTSISS